MTNFEKLKERITLGEMVSAIYELCDSCEFCVYDNKTCSGEDCEYGIKKWLERKAEENEN